MLYEFDGKSPKIEADSYVSETAILVGDVTIGHKCYIGHGVVMRGDYGSIVIGSGSAIEEGVVIHAPPKEICNIGEMVTAGHGAIIHASVIAEFSVRSRRKDEAGHPRLGHRRRQSREGHPKRPAQGRRILACGQAALY